MWNVGLLRFSQSFRQFTAQCMKQTRLISTSRKNRETATITEKVEEQATECKVKKNWVSYGFDNESETEDRNALHSTMFVTVTLCMVVGGFLWAYMPDFRMRDWSQREAFLELRRRGALGLPLVDRNLIDPAKMILPSEEELGDTEIII